MTANRKKRILVAPLNWGLGHASRCIPIVRALVNSGAEVVLAADGRPFDFLKNEFPGFELRRLPDIDIRYIEQSSMLASMLRQAPHVVLSYLRERTLMPRIVNEWKIDGLISDNRFGLFTPAIPCIYVTHQITIMTPPAIAWLEPLLRRLHASVINRFTECWIPDNAGEINLSGGLSHHCALPDNAFFIGPLSRLSRSAAADGTYDLAVVLSGPEPQRTVFEKLIREQLRGTRLRAIIVQGKPERYETGRDSETVEIVSSLTAGQLNAVLMGARIVVSRSGYSSVMDLAALGKNAVLVPTPGQTEQEYVAARLREMNIFYSEEQSVFDLNRALERSRSFSGWTMDAQQNDLLDERIGHFLSIINP